MSDDGPLLTDNTAAVFSEMERERDEARDKLEWHRQMADYHAKKRVETEAERDALREALLKVDRLFHEANNLPEHERPAPRDLERLKREAWRATREALAGLEEA